MSSEEWIGWELTYHSVKNAISKKEDVLVVFLHWALIKSGCLCVGLGELEDVENKKGSELLPEGWNKNDSYSIRYISLKGDKPFLLKASIVKEFLVLEFVRIEDMTITTLTLNSNTVPVTDFDKPLEELIPEHKSIWKSFKTELIAKLLQPHNKEEETQTTTPHLPVRPSSPDNDWFHDHGRDRDRDRSRYADPFGVGRSDLDPIGRGRDGRGMLFEPYNPLRDRRFPPHPGLGVIGGLPRGSIPPGARFDPFGPPDLGYPGPRRRLPPDVDDDSDSMPTFYM